MKKSVKQKIDKFYSEYTEKYFEKGQILIYAGENPPGIFYLIDGQIKQYDITESGNEVIINVFQEPTIVPAAMAINNIENKYFYECSSSVIVRSAPIKIMAKFLKDNPDVVYDLLSRVYHGVEDIQTRMAYMMGGSTRNRVLLELLLECRKTGILQSDGSYVLNLHEHEIADRAGLSRETVSRHLSKIGLGRLVKVTRKNITVSDIDKLEKELGGSIS